MKKNKTIILLTVVGLQMVKGQSHQTKIQFRYWKKLLSKLRNLKKIY